MSEQTYRAAIVGLGGIAIGRSRQEVTPPPFAREVLNRHVHTIHGLPNIELVAVCDIAPTAVDRFKDLWGKDLPETRTYADVGEMLSNEKLDIVGIATADHAHAAVTVEVAHSGVKGIFVEKPLATSLEDADSMIAACEANNVVLNVDHTRRYRPLVHRVRQAIRDGAIGEVGAAALHHFGTAATLFRNGTHFIDVMCFVIDSAPVKVSALLDEGFDDWDRYRGDGGRTRGAEPGAIGTIIFSNGVRASYTSTIHNSFYSTGMMVTGSEGNIEFEMNGDSARLTSGHVTSPLGPSVQTIVPNQYQIIGIPAGYRELMDVIENGVSSVSPAREARKTIQIMTGFLQSHQQGSRLIDVPA